MDRVISTLDSGAATEEARGAWHFPGRLYRCSQIFWRFAFFFTMRVRARGLENVPRQGGVILAVTHRSHLDPVAVSTLLDREVGWMARVEFYQRELSRAFMNAMGAFPVNRMRPGIAPIREASRRLARGLVVGIFPEGEVQIGGGRVTHGGPIKSGAVYLAALTGCPIVPVLVVGTDKLSSPWPWMPAKWGRLWIRIGEPMRIPAGARSRAGRVEATEQLRDTFHKLYEGAEQEWKLPEDLEK